MKITYPIRTDSFTPCKSREERALYGRMCDLLRAIPASERLAQEAELWLEHSEAKAQWESRQRYVNELKVIVGQLAAIRPDVYSLSR
jgi:hypothetical protein